MGQQLTKARLKLGLGALVVAGSLQHPSIAGLLPSDHDSDAQTRQASSPETGQHRQLGRTLAASRHGWDGRQWDCLETLWHNESNWNPNADNPTSSAYGIPQALTSLHDLPAGYMTSPETQIEWGLDYIDDRYNTPCQALSAWQSRNPHWY